MNNTEKRNPRSTHIDTMPLSEALSLINEENKLVFEAIDKALPEIEAACEVMIKSIKNGGRILYIGAGTSGRLGVMDAAECPPTYGVAKDLFTGVIAGGPNCMFTAAEAQEDDPAAARRDLDAAGLKAGDVILTRNGEPVADALAFVRMNQTSKGESVTLAIEPSPM